jgi:N-acetylglucosamine-6-phosphate deacetylase
MISDALRCSGMPEGEYELGGQPIFLENNAVVAKLSDGTVAGSVSNLYKGLQNVIRFGIPEEDAVRAATWNPACAIGKQDKIGSIEPGKLADFIVCAPDYSEKRVFLGGKELK